MQGAARGAIDASRWSPPPVAQNGWGRIPCIAPRAPAAPSACSYLLPPAARAARHIAGSAIRTAPPPFPAMPMQRKRCRAPSASPARRQPATAQGRAQGPAIPVAPSPRLAAFRASARRQGAATMLSGGPCAAAKTWRRTPPALAARAQVSLHGPRAAGSAPARSRRRPPTNGKNRRRPDQRHDAGRGVGAAARAGARQARGRRACIAGVPNVRRSRCRCRCRCRRSALRRP